MIATRLVRHLAPAACVAVLLTAGSALAHSERFIPDFGPRPGAVPDLNRVARRTLVVCKASSKPTRADHDVIHQRLANPASPEDLAAAQAEEAAWHRNSRLFRRCRYEHIQDAANAAADDTAILVLPGVYREEPSRAAPTTSCGDLPDCSYSYAYHVTNPNDANLVAILGKTNITLEGTGATPRNVLVDAGFAKDVGIRCDRCTGFIVRNLWQRDANEHGIYVIDSTGYVFDRTVGSYSREYELFAFASDHGLFTDCEAEGGGDSGIYVGASPDTGNPEIGGRFSAEIRRCSMHDNALGFSGTQGNSVWMHDNDVYDNAIGLSFNSQNDHANFPQTHSIIEDNLLHDNNLDVYVPTSPVPVLGPGYSFFRYPVGTGMWLVGGDENVIRDNFVYGNDRFGFIIAANAFEGPLPAEINGNQVYGNIFGLAPDLSPAPNLTAFPPPGCGGDPTLCYNPGGSDIFWDRTGLDNCFGPQDPGSGPVKTDPVAIPAPCPSSNGVDTVYPPFGQLALLLSCALEQVPGSDPPEFVTGDNFYPCPWGQVNLGPYLNTDELECGNGAVDLGEDCDGGYGGGGASGESCESLGHGPDASAALACSSLCTWDTSGCAAPTCGRYGSVRVKLRHLDPPGGDDELDLNVSRVDGSGRVFSPPTEEVSVAFRDASGVFYAGRIPSGSAWTALPDRYVFTDGTGANDGIVRFELRAGRDGFAGPLRAMVRVRGATLSAALAARTGRVTLRVGNDCWTREMPCMMGATGRSGICRWGNRP
jgi:hypothetical protein